jgi:ABC-type oligopeptide transport system ATPase subunit
VNSHSAVTQRRAAGAPLPRDFTHPGEPILQTHQLSLWYGKQQALDSVTLDIAKNKITAIIGPSGCGKSTLIRCFNRMNDLVPGVRLSGEVLYHGKNIYDPDVDPVEVRRRIGMVFQKPNPFPNPSTRTWRSGCASTAFGELGRARRAGAARRGPVGRSQRLSAHQERLRSIWGSAAALVHRAHAGDIAERTIYMVTGQKERKKRGLPNAML